MAGIYDRDNYAQLMQTALNNAYNRREATQRQRAERVKEIVAAGGDFAKVLGRTAEEWDVPDQYKDDPDYRAARFDYVLGGDRSGLDAFRQAEMQAEQARRQQEFTAAENALNRRMQMGENEKNRAIQRQQHGLEKMTEKARLLRDVRDAQAILADMEGENKSKYNEVDRAKARNHYDLTVELLKKSGQFTDAEIAKLNGGAAGSTGGTLDAQVASARANGWQAPMAPAKAVEETKQETEKEDPAESWNKFNARYGEIANADQKQLDALEAEYGKHSKDEANADEYEKWGQGITKRKKELKAAAEAKQKASAKNESARQMVENGLITKSEIRAALDMDQKGGGKTEGTLEKSWVYNGKIEPMKIDIKRNGLSTKLYVDGQYVGDIGLGF